MAFRITITREAESQLRALPVREQRILESALLARLIESPAQSEIGVVGLFNLSIPEPVLCRMDFGPTTILRHVCRDPIEAPMPTSKARTNTTSFTPSSARPQS